MNISRATQLLILVAAFAASAAANAAGPSGWYMGASVGNSKSDYSSADAQFDFGYAPNVSVENSATTTKLYLGYNFNQHVGLEFGYIDLGKTKISGTVFGVPSADELHASGINLDLVGSVPLNSNLSLFAKGGTIFANAGYYCKQACFGISDHTESENVSKFGAGLEYVFPSRVGLRVEYERVGDVTFKLGGAAGPETKVSYDMVSIGVVAHF